MTNSLMTTAAAKASVVPEAVIEGAPVAEPVWTLTTAMKKGRSSEEWRRSGDGARGSANGALITITMAKVMVAPEAALEGEPTMKPTRVLATATKKGMPTDGWG
jgi:hypothetical protein